MAPVPFGHAEEEFPATFSWYCWSRVVSKMEGIGAERRHRFHVAFYTMLSPYH